MENEQVQNNSELNSEVNSEVKYDPFHREKIKLKLQFEHVWHLADHQSLRGPYSDLHIFNLIESGIIHDYSDLWSKKNNLWVKAIEVDKFKSKLNQYRAKTDARKVHLEKAKLIQETEKKIQQIYEENFSKRSKNLITTAESNKNQSTEFWNYLESNHPELVKTKQSYELKQHVVTTLAKPKVGLSILTGTLVSFMLSYYFYFEKFNFTSHFELSELQNQEAKVVKLSSLTQNGLLKKTFSFLKADALKLIIVTNLQDNSLVEVELEGVSDTLVGAFDSSIKAQTRVKDGFINLKPIDLSSESSMVKGDYLVKLKCLSCNDEINEAANYEKIFIGGVKNQDYDYQLIQYHIKLRQHVRSEIDELDQLTLLLKQSFIDFKNLIASFEKENSLQQSFEKINSLNEQITKAISEKSKFLTQNKIFYKNYFLKIKNQSQKLTEVISEFNNTLANKKLTMSLNAKFEKSEQLSNVLNQLIIESENHIIYSKKLKEAPLTSNGMPQRF